MSGYPAIRGCRRLDAKPDGVILAAAKGGLMPRRVREPATYRSKISPATLIK
jgi:hypothetical protein